MGGNVDGSDTGTGETIRRTVDLDAAPGEVWEAITDPEDLSAWLGGRVELEMRPGGPLRFEGDDGERRRGSVETVEPGRRLVFRWWDSGQSTLTGSRVEFLVEGEDDHTTLTVVERPMAMAH